MIVGYNQLVSKNLLEAVADPVRLRLLRALAGREAMTIAELATGAGVHPNTVRVHLAALEHGRVVQRERGTADLRGRPAVRYGLRPGWRLPTTDMSGLAELLAELALRNMAPGRSEQVGVRWGRYLAGRPGTDCEHQLGVALERLGFDHERSGQELRLTACPCPLVAPHHPQLVCRLVQAVIDGLLEMRDQPLRVTASRHDTVRRSCTMTLAPMAAAPPTTPSGRRLPRRRSSQ
jgi:predicted ArsR family transcriptional regulator